MSMCSKNEFVPTARIVILANWRNSGDHIKYKSILDLTVVQR